jgi:hypothetical protein
MSYVRVVHACGCVGAEVHHLMTLAGKVFNQLILVLHACVVVANSDFHILIFVFVLQI